MDEKKALEIKETIDHFFDIEGISEIDRWHVLISMTLTYNEGATISYIKDRIKKEERLK